MFRVLTHFVSSLVVGLAFGCSGSDSFSSNDGGECTGQEQCHCYANGTCNDGLSCLSNYCVQLTDASRTTGSQADPPDGNLDAGTSQGDPESSRSSTDPSSSPTAGDSSETEDGSASVAQSDATESQSDATQTESNGETSELDTEVSAEPSPSSDELDAGQDSPMTSSTADDEPTTSTLDTASQGLDSGAGSSPEWTMSEGKLDGNDGWSSISAGAGVNFEPPCLELWGAGKVDLRWDGPQAQPMLLDPLRTYELLAEGHVENTSKFLLGVQYGPTDMPDAAQFYQGLYLDEGPFSFQQTFQGIEGRGTVAFRMNVLEATEPYGRFCLDSAVLREVQ